MYIKNTKHYTRQKITGQWYINYRNTSLTKYVINKDYFIKPYMAKQQTQHCLFTQNRKLLKSYNNTYNTKCQLLIGVSNC